jgi:hypothetical protein
MSLCLLIEDGCQSRWTKGVGKTSSGFSLAEQAADRMVAFACARDDTRRTVMAARLR